MACKGAGTDDMRVQGAFVTPAPPIICIPAAEGEGVKVLEVWPPRGVMIALRDWRGGRIGPRGGERGQEDGEGQTGIEVGQIERVEGKNMPCCCCCCCWRRVIATFEAAAAVCKGAWTNGAQITGRGCEDTPPATVPAVPPIQLPVATSCMAGMLSCLTICCTKMLSQDPAHPRPLLAPPGPGPGPGPPPRPRVLLATEPP